MNSAEKKAAVAGVFDRGSGSYEQLGPQFFTPMGLALVARAAISPGERILDVGCRGGAASCSPPPRRPAAAGGSSWASTSPPAWSR